MKPSGGILETKSHDNLAVFYILRLALAKYSKTPIHLFSACSSRETFYGPPIVPAFLFSSQQQDARDRLCENIRNMLYYNSYSLIMQHFSFRSPESGISGWGWGLLKRDPGRGGCFRLEKNLIIGMGSTGQPGLD